LGFEGFLCSDCEVLTIDGDAGTGKSALLKNALAHLSDGTMFLAFKSTDLDVDDKLKFFSSYGSLQIDEVLDI
jgi:ABC-type phosphonate transport system ATPase subunit